jgi:ERF superfamily
MPDQPASLAAALAELQQHLPRIGKNAEGQRSRYADLPEVSRALLPLLAGHGLSFTSCPGLAVLNGEVKFVLDYRLLHSPSGEAIGGQYPLGTGTPQQLGSAITYARRYCLLAVTGAAPDDGSDDDAAAAEQSAREMRRRPPETRADGSATEAEQTRMVRGREPGTTRHDAVPPDDPWYDEPGQPLSPPSEDASGSIGPQQKARMFAMFAGLGMRDKAAQLDFIYTVTGGARLNSRNDLSYRQAAKVLEALEERSRSGAKV